MTRWSQFVAMAAGQLCARRSLRDLVANLAAQHRRLYHLGIGVVSRSSLARVNEQQPYQLYEALFFKLYARCQPLTPKHRLHIDSPLFSLDASLIDLSLKIFPWARLSRKKGCVKLHTQLDHSGMVPAFAMVTDGKTSDLTVAKTLRFPAGSMVVFDRGYLDYQWWEKLGKQGVFFVSRLRKNSEYAIVERQPVRKGTGVTSDWTIRLTGQKSRRVELSNLRLVGYRDPETGKHYRFVTNRFDLSPKTIADIYQQRWQVELFFRWIKQNLKLSSFVGTSPNAILTQIWVAMCMYLLLSYLKLLAQLGLSLGQLLRLIQVNLFARRDLLELLGQPPPQRKPPPQLSPQLVLL